MRLRSVQLNETLFHGELPHHCAGSGRHGKAGGCKSADEEACMDQIKAFMGSVRR